MFLKMACELHVYSRLVGIKAEKSSSDNHHHHRRHDGHVVVMEL